MDGRGALRWSGILLLATAGCQHQMMTVPNPGPLSSTDKAPVLDRSQIQPASAKAKELPPQVWVSCGDFKAGEASAADTPPDQQQHIRELARADYEQALKLDRKYVPAYQGLARLYMSTRDTPLAIETYQKALQIAPQNAALWYELGMCHNAEKNWETALKCLNRATQLDPRNRSYANAKAVVLAESGRYDESLSCFIRCSGEAQGYYRLAQTLQRLQQPELSRHYLEMALQRDPSLAGTLAMRREEDGATKPPAAPVQQTAYQDASQTPNVSAAPIAAAAPPVVVTPPTVVTPPPVVASSAAAAAPTTPAVVSTAEEPSEQQPVIPPPPAVTDHYE